MASGNLVSGVSTKKPRLEQLEFSRWVGQRLERLAENWLAEVISKQARPAAEVEALLAPFLKLLTSMIPASLGPYRSQVEPLWLQVSELFGSVAAQRGLAAGESIEEFQILREILIRELYADPPAGGVPISLRDLLRLNRLIDRGITQASVGHADVLFFALFQGSGVPEHLSEEVVREVRAQLDSIAEEFRTVMASLKD